MEEELLLEKPQVFVYKIPTELRKRVVFLHRAADWDIAHPIWYGKLLVYKAGHDSCRLELRDRKGYLYGKSIVKEYPGKDLMPVQDSSRYFTLNVKNGDGRFEMMGIGFGSRSDSLDVDAVIRSYFERTHKCDNHFQLSDEASSAKRIKTEVDRIDVPMNEADQSDRLQTEPLEGNAVGTNVKTEVDDQEETSLVSAGIGYASTAEAPNVVQEDEKQLEMTEDSEVGTLDSKDHPRVPKKTWLSVFKCSFCTEQLELKDDLVQHFRNSHAENEVPGDIPEGIFPKTKSKYQPDQNSSSPAEIYARTKDDHYKHYISGNVFQCGFCDESFADASEIMQHWSARHDHIHLTALLCECGLPFPSRRKLKIHQRRFHSFRCLVCRSRLKTLKTLEDVSEHMLVSHLCSPSGKTIHTPDSQDFSCEDCDGWYSLKQAKWMHMPHRRDAESSLNGFLCPVPQCGSAPKTKWGLKKHLRVVHGCTKKKMLLSVIPPDAQETDVETIGHEECSELNSANHKVLACTFCKDKLGSQDALIHHYRSTHYPERISSAKNRFAEEQGRKNVSSIAQCPFCTRIFLNKALVEEHLLTAHLCDASAKTIHTPDPREFSCSVCPGWFSFETQTWKHYEHEDRRASRLVAFSCPVPECMHKPKGEIELQGHLCFAHNYGGYKALKVSRRRVRVRKISTRKILCGHCDKNCRNPNKLRKHSQKKHPGVPPVIKPTLEPQNPRMLKCLLCTEPFLSTIRLRKHLRSTQHSYKPVKQEIVN